MIKNLEIGLAITASILKGDQRIKALYDSLWFTREAGDQASVEFGTRQFQPAYNSTENGERSMLQ